MPHHSNWITTTTGSPTITINAESNTQLDLGLDLGNKDLTPDDPFETAELKLAGICPACRNDEGFHTWDCKHYDYSAHNVITGAGITYNSSYQPNITIGTSTSISLGQATLDEAKVQKLDKLLDLFDDDELDQLILDKLTKKVDKE